MVAEVQVLIPGIPILQKSSSDIGYSGKLCPVLVAFLPEEPVLIRRFYSKMYLCAQVPSFRCAPSVTGLEFPVDLHENIHYSHHHDVLKHNHVVSQIIIMFFHPRWPFGCWNLAIKIRVKTFVNV
jgi:hypothetical protein